MIEIGILSAPFSCRTKELLWYRETKKCIALLQDGKSLQEIKNLSQNENIFNISSVNRADNILAALFRRVHAVNERFLAFFEAQDTITQKQLCIVLVMLTDHTFYKFMDDVFREKLIMGVSELPDSDIVGYFHGLQEIDGRAAKWTDATIAKIRNNYKHILREAEFISDEGATRQIIRPILNEEMVSFLKEEGLQPIYKIMSGEAI